MSSATKKDEKTLKDSNSPSSSSCSHMGCLGCELGPVQQTLLELQIFERSIKNQMPIVRPIVDSDPPYAFTIGIPILTCETDKNKAGEIVMVGLAHENSASILTLIGKLIAKNEIKQSEWKDGTILRLNGLSCQLKIRVLDESMIEKHLTSSRNPNFKIPRVSLAYQLLWPDANGDYTNEILKHQEFGGITS